MEDTCFRLLKLINRQCKPKNVIYGKHWPLTLVFVFLKDWVIYINLKQTRLDHS